MNTDHAIEFSWAAGLFEGEGTIRINKATARNLGTLCVSVVNTDKSVLDFFQERWPGYMKPITMSGNRRPAWMWVIAAKKAIVFLNDIRPYVQTGRVRRKLELAIEFQSHKQHGQGRLMGYEYREDDFGYYLLMRELNTRGINA